MNDLERDILQKLVQDGQLFAVLKSFFDRNVEKQLPKVNDIDNDTTLGQKYRAYIEARCLIDDCFNELESQKKVEVDNIDLNRAR